MSIGHPSVTGDKRDTERRIIMENQIAIMNALIALLPSGHTATGDLYYSTAMTRAYMGPKQ